MARGTLSHPQVPRSEAVLALRQVGAPALERLAELSGLSLATVSRALAGRSPMPGELVGSLRVLIGVEATERVSALAEVARLHHLRGLSHAAV
jgi:hypothetical protein